MSIEPFQIAVPDAILEDLHRRLDATLWPDTLPDAGWDYGTDIDVLRALVDHWRHRFDWRAREAELNRFPQFEVELGDAKVHCIWARAHGRSKPILPLVLTHGWPSTFYELTAVVEPLTRAGFDVVVPSLPGYGFSSPPKRRGFGAGQVADLWVELMAKLGYARFGSHGGDWGSAVTTALGARHPEKLVGLHVNMLAPPVDPAQLTDEERVWWQGVLDYRDREWGYVHLQRTKPQTASFALTDSPVGLAAWLLEKWWRWSDIEDEAGRRVLSRRYTNDQLLTTIMLYWVTRSIGPTMRMYYETFARGNQIPQPARIEVPLGVAAFKEANRVPRRLAEPHYDVVRWEIIDDGGHFPGLENPARLAQEIAAFFTPLAG
ncbi:epoxide hydrolase 1 [Myxococcota bacterium]|nr:epoxide hydrolase 1 [Myxococcota bacterium]